MLYILTALKCEAAALTGLPGQIVVTGVGERCISALEKIQLTPQDRVLNVGCCAGTGIVGAYLASCLENADTGKRFYPDMRSESTLPEMKLVTSSSVVTETEDGILYDMEAARICEWAMKKIAPSNIAVIKVVSDDGKSLPSANEVTKLIREHIAEIKTVAESLAEEDGCIEDSVPAGLGDELKLSQYMRNEFALLWHYSYVSGRRDELVGFLDSKREEGLIPVKDKRAGKEILDEIYARLR